jgi:nitrile hydratase accessory protein
MKAIEELLAGTPLQENTTFSAPWEARAFAMAVRLSESGICTWEEFRRHLIEQIGKGDKVRAHGWVEGGEGYYTHFLGALENLLRQKAIVDSSALADKMHQISSSDHDH